VPQPLNLNVMFTAHSKDEPMTISYKQKINNIFTQDPKPIFDHIRNIGIAAAVIIGAGLLKASDFAANSKSPEVINLAALSLAIGGTILFIINMKFAQNNISALILDKHASTGVLDRLSLVRRLIKARKRINKKILTSILIFYAKDFVAQTFVVFYYVFIFSLVTAQVLSSPESPTQKNTPPKNELYINIEKFNSAFNEMIEKNKILEAELKELQDRLNVKSARVLDLENALNEEKKNTPLDTKNKTHAPETKT
jgi:hypothetical protein